MAQQSQVAIAIATTSWKALPSKLNAIVFPLVVNTLASFCKYLVPSALVLCAYAIARLFGVDQIKLVGLLPLSYLVHLVLIVFTLRFVWSVIRG